MPALPNQGSREEIKLNKQCEWKSNSMVRALRNEIAKVLKTAKKRGFWPCFKKKLKSYLCQVVAGPWSFCAPCESPGSEQSRGFL
jgi:hypothetical protein